MVNNARPTVFPWDLHAPYLSHAALLDINASSVKARRQRNLWQDELPADAGAVYQVAFAWLVPGAVDTMRVIINLGGDFGATLDMSCAEFDSLERNE